MTSEYEFTKDELVMASTLIDVPYDTPVITDEIAPMVGVRQQQGHWAWSSTSRPPSPR
jgi:hypothetical protein